MRSGADGSGPGRPAGRRPGGAGSRPLAPDLVVAPALGGIVLGYELGRQLGRNSIFVERVEAASPCGAASTSRRAAGSWSAEDVITTGLSTRECMACCRAQGGEIVAVACLIDRSNGKAELGVPLVSLATLDLPTYPQHKLPAPSSRRSPPSSRARAAWTCGEALILPLKLSLPPSWSTPAPTHPPPRGSRRSRLTRRPCRAAQSGRPCRFEHPLWPYST